MEGSRKKRCQLCVGGYHHRRHLLKQIRVGMGLQVREVDVYAGGLGRLFWS